MAERPILFQGAMVRAILDGSKTQTRRALRVQPPAETFAVSTCHHPDSRPHFYAWVPREGGGEISDWPPVPCPYGVPGDRLWVRETFRGPLNDGTFGHRATHDGPLTWESYTWRPSIHMPRAACRLLLDVVAVRVERLQAISEAEAIAEGIERSHIDSLKRQQWKVYPHRDGNPGPDGEVVTYCGSRFTSKPVEAYKSLWLSINGAGSWDANPWVWVVEFRKVTA